MSKHHIFVIMGKSSAGKDTIAKRILTYSLFPISKVVTYTTRPKRSGEKEGREYHFVTDADILRLHDEGKIIDLHEYHTANGSWYYSTVDDGQINLGDHDSLVIGTPEIVQSLRVYFKDNPKCVVPILIDVEPGERLKRALDRERRQKNPNYKELCRRFLSDEADFDTAVLKEKVGEYVTFMNDDFETCLLAVEKYISEYGKEASCS